MFFTSLFFSSFFSFIWLSPSLYIAFFSNFIWAFSSPLWPLCLLFYFLILCFLSSLFKPSLNLPLMSPQMFFRIQASTAQRIPLPSLFCSTLPLVLTHSLCKKRVLFFFLLPALSLHHSDHRALSSLTSLPVFPQWCLAFSTSVHL